MWSLRCGADGLGLGVIGLHVRHRGRRKLRRRRGRKGSEHLRHVDPIGGTNRRQTDMSETRVEELASMCIAAEDRIVSAECIGVASNVLGDTRRPHTSLPYPLRGIACARRHVDQLPVCCHVDAVSTSGRVQALVANQRGKTVLGPQRVDTLEHRGFAVRVDGGCLGGRYATGQGEQEEQRSPHGRASDKYYSKPRSTALGALCVEPDPRVAPLRTDVHVLVATACHSETNTTERTPWNVASFTGSTLACYG